MQPEPSGSSVRPSNGDRKVIQGELSQRLKRKACGDDSRKKFLKVSGDFVVSPPQAAYHRLDVSDVSTRISSVNSVTSDPTPIAFKRGTVKDEKIYLDLKDGQMTHDLEKYITRFGGIVEKFLSKDITCVVTNHISPNDTKAENAILKKEAFSPHTAEKPKPDICSSLGAMSRGKTLLLRSNSTKASSSVCGPVQFAHTWKIPVVEVSVLRKLLKKENDHRKQVSSQSSRLSVKKLDKPFVKVEDTMQMYSTNFRLFNTFPISYLSSLDSLACNAASQSKDSSVEKKTKQKRVKKSGYCECCDVSFTDQKEHFNCRMHKAFVMRNENFASLDVLVSKLPSLEKFALAMELDTKNLLSPGSITRLDQGLVHGLSDSQTQDHKLNPSFVQDVAVHGTKRLYPGSNADLKVDVRNRCDAQNLKSKRGVLPDTFCAPNSSCPIRKPRTKKSQNTSSKSCTLNSNSFHGYEKCDDEKTLLKANGRHAEKLVNRNYRIPKKGSHSDLNVDSNCPVDLSLPKSSTGVSSYQSPVSFSSTVFELDSANATVSKAKISEVSRLLKIDDDVSQKKPVTSDCSDNVSDISELKKEREQTISERMDISLDMKSLAATVANSAELRSPFLGSANVTSKEVSKDDDLDFSSDEVSDSADEKIDWRINLRNSCKKVLNILEDSNSSKDLAKDILDADDCVSNSSIKRDLTDVRVTETCHKVNSDKKEFQLSNCQNLKMSVGGQPAFGIEAGLDETTASKVSPKETSMSCRTKYVSVGIVRPWEIVSTKPELNQLHTDKEGHCEVRSQMQGASDTSGCVLQTDECSSSNTEYRQTKSSESCAAAATKTREALLPEAAYSDGDSDPQTTHSIKGVPEVTHLNENSNSEIKYSTEGSNLVKTPSAEDTTAKIDSCTGESAVITTMSCYVPENILHSSTPVKVCITGQSTETVTPEILPTAAAAESPTRFQDSPHSSSQSSIIVDVEAYDERSDISEEKGLIPMPSYEVLTPVKPQLPSSLDTGNRSFAFGSNYEAFDKQVVSQPPSSPTTPGQIISQSNTVTDFPISPTVSQQLIDRSLTNGHTSSDVLSGFKRHKQHSACSSLDSGFCASIKTVTVDSYTDSPVENCARNVEAGEPGICEPKCIPSHTEDSVSLSQPVPTRPENSDSLPVAENMKSCTAAIPVDSLVPSQCKATNPAPLNSQSDYSASTELLATRRTSCSIAVPLEAENSDKVNLQLQPECASSIPAPVQTLDFSPVSTQAEKDDTSAVLCETANNKLLLVSGQSRTRECTQLLSLAENSDSFPLIQVENIDPSANQEEKSDSLSTVNNTENHSYSPVEDKHQIDEINVDKTEYKDVILHTLPTNEDKKVDDVANLACTADVQGPPMVATVPEVHTYPDLMSGIDELPEKAKKQMPDLLMEAKNNTALDSPVSSTCTLLMSTQIHQTASAALPSGSNFSSSEPMDVGFGELSEDFFTARSNPITFYEVDKSEEVPWIDNAWGSTNHTVETSAAVDTWPEELATIVPSSCSNDLSQSCCNGLDSLMMSAPIGTPHCVSFSDDDCCVPIAKKGNTSGVVLCEPQTEIRSANSVNSVAEPSGLDDDVLTALSRILEDASKEWQAERQRSNSTDPETTVCSAVSVYVADKEVKQETCNKISVSRTSSVETPTTAPLMQTPEPIVQIELQSAEKDETNKVNLSETVCSVPQSRLLENNSSCVDGAQDENRTVLQGLQLCINDAKKESDDASDTEPVSAQAGDLDDLDKLMQMLKALNEETKFDDHNELTSSCNIAAINSCQTLKKDNSSKLVLDLPNNFCDSFGGNSSTKTHKTSRQVAAATGSSVHLFGESSSVSVGNFSNDINERVCQFQEKNRKDRCKWKMTYISGLKFLFQRLLHSPDKSHCFGKYSIKTLGSERLALCISKNKSKFNVKS